MALDRMDFPKKRTMLKVVMPAFLFSLAVSSVLLFPSEELLSTGSLGGHLGFYIPMGIMGAFITSVFPGMVALSRNKHVQDPAQKGVQRIRDAELIVSSVLLAALAIGSMIWVFGFAGIETVLSSLDPEKNINALFAGLLYAVPIAIYGLTRLAFQPFSRKYQKNRVGIRKSNKQKIDGDFQNNLVAKCDNANFLIPNQDNAKDKEATTQALWNVHRGREWNETRVAAVKKAITPSFGKRVNLM